MFESWKRRSRPEIPSKPSIEREIEAGEKIWEMFSARPEYVSGSEKLNFEHTFTTGEVFKALQDNEGIARISIFRNSEEILNFNNLIPSYTLATPTYIQNHSLSLNNFGNWGASASYNLIAVGDMRSPYSILALLHEMGHAENYSSGKSQADTLPRLRHLSETLRHDEDRVLIRQLANEFSDTERDAWAQALRIVRDVKIEHEVDLVEPYKNVAEIREVVYGCLITHRLSTGERMKLIDNEKGGLFAEVKNRLSKMLTGKRATEEWKFLDTLFDKRRLK